MLRRALLLAILLLTPVSVAHASPSGEPSSTPTPTVSGSPSASPTAFPVSLALGDAISTVTDAQSKFEVAAGVARSAQVDVDTMVDSAIRANGELRGLSGNVNTVARQIYMNGMPTTTQLLIESDSPNISDAITGVQFARSAVDGVAAKIIEDRAAALDVRHNYYLTRARLEAANRSLTDAQAALGEARALVLAEAPTDSADAFTALVSLDEVGCPTAIPEGTADGMDAEAVNKTCHSLLASQDLTPASKTALKFAFSRLGAPYACGGVGRESAWQFDCSSFTVAAYRAAGIDTKVAGVFSPTTFYMLGHPDVFKPVDATDLRPGDLVLYDTCPEGEVCAYNHVVLYAGTAGGVPWMLHTNSCGTPAKLVPFWGVEDSAHGKFLRVARIDSSPIVGQYPSHLF